MMPSSKTRRIPEELAPARGCCLEAISQSEFFRYFLRAALLERLHDLLGALEALGGLVPDLVDHVLGSTVALGG
jgi:hypothetical protein